MTLLPSGFGGTWGGGAFTAAATAPDGTSVLPGYAFTSEPSLGMYRSATGILRLVAAGSSFQVSGTQIGYLGAGTPTLPQLFINDTTLGFWRPALNVMSIGASGTTIVTIASSGLSLIAGALSLNTSANASGQTTGELRVVFQASGISLMYSSGKSSYVIGQSAQSVVQP